MLKREFSCQYFWRRDQTLGFGKLSRDSLFYEGINRIVFDWMKSNLIFTPLHMCPGKFQLWKTISGPEPDRTPKSWKLKIADETIRTATVILEMFGYAVTRMGHGRIIIQGNQGSKSSEQAARIPERYRKYMATKKHNRISIPEATMMRNHTERRSERWWPQPPQHQGNRGECHRLRVPRTAHLGWPLAT